MKVKVGDRFLYKFGWFGTSFGGFFERPYKTFLNVVEGYDGELWFKEDNGTWFSDIPNGEITDKKFIKLLTKI